ncbi:MAG: hypothetical protein FWD65_05605 [Coriobacteriia bacterium]|nr:hypothetical protein [Coriobacteriia bacterium]
MPEEWLVLMLQSHSLDPDDVELFSFRCLGSSKWIDFSTFLQFVNPPEIGPGKDITITAIRRFAKSPENAVDFPPDFFDDPDEKQEPLFYPVSQRKFLLMTVSTFGLYYFFWVFKMWSYFRGIDIRFDKWHAPLLLTVLEPFSSACLTTQTVYLAEYANKNVLMSIYRTSWIITLRGSLLMFGLFALFPPTRFFLVFLLLIPVTYLPFIKKINDTNAKRAPEYTPDDHFSVFHIMWFAISLILIIAAIGSSLYYF